ncbi:MULTISPECIES: TerB family tellurite resistance protein [unclassified Sulfurospirillum]|uniref:TerB family tellurite resistance protein n=1 Tax=unclassified Sulfurospirillum TaxID=2618290 RepID=UPI0025EB2EEF|nr:MULTISPECIES: TerB family tellurite resistance protein [unclassified Sulfurospirillum]
MKLKTEEKFAFLQLAQYVAKLDGEYGLKERELVNEYCTEMGIENMEINLEQFNLEETLQIFRSTQSRKITVLSLMVLVHIDDKFGIYEHKTMDQIAQRFTITEKEMHLFSMWGKMGSALFEQAMVFTAD